MIQLQPMMPWAQRQNWSYFNLDNGLPRSTLGPRFAQFLQPTWHYGTPPCLSCCRGDSEKDKRERRVAWVLVILFVTCAVVAGVLYLLSYLGVWDVFDLDKSSPVKIPVCTVSTGLVMRLVYDPSSSTIQDTSGLGCSVDMRTTDIMSQGDDPVVGPYWTGFTQRGFDLVGCSSYSWTQWLQLQNPVMLNSRIMTIYSQTDLSTGPFPLTGFIFGCGLGLLGTHSYAIPPSTWVHVAMTYDSTTLNNTWFINGQQVFTWFAYTDPPPFPYLSGVLTLNLFQPEGSNQQILLGETHLWCSALQSYDVLEDAAMVTSSFPPLAVAYPADTSVVPQLPLPAHQYQGNQNANDLAAFYCSFPSVQSDQAIPTSVPSTYTIFYIDQVSGSDASLGLSPGLGAWQSLQNTAIFGNIGYNYAILTEATAFDNGLTIPAQLTPTLAFPSYPTVVSGSGLLPNGKTCNLWSWTQANTGSVVTNLGAAGDATHAGVVVGGPLEGTASMWLRVASVAGTVHLPPNGQGFSNDGSLTTTISPLNSTAYTFSFGSTTNQLPTPLNYNVMYYLTWVWSCPLSYLQFYRNGQLIGTVNGLQVCPKLGGGAMQPFMYSDGQTNTFTGYMGGMLLYFIALQQPTVQALYRLVSNAQSPCSMVEFCMDLRICEGSRFFGAVSGLQLMQSAVGCPTVVESYNCGYGTDQFLIDGAVILPQTSQIGWTEINYTNPSTGVNRPVLMYDLTKLYALTGTEFLPFNPLQPYGRYPASTVAPESSGSGTPLPGYMPFVLNDLPLTPRGPNIDSPRYPFGNRFSHSLHTLSYLSKGDLLENPSPNQGYYTAAYYAANSHLQPTPASWCNLTWNEMYGQNTTLYKQTIAANIVEMNQAQAWSLMWTYDNQIQQGSTVTFVYPGSGIIDCEHWYNAEIANDLPSAPSIPWTDPSLGLYGLWPSHASTSGYLIPQCQPACFEFPQFFDQVYPPTPNQPAPPFTPNPFAQAEGGWQAVNSWFLQGDQFTTAYFDGPGEAYYNQTSGQVLFIPWSDVHKQTMLQTSSIALDAVTVAQNPSATSGWTRLMDRNTQLGLTVGYAGYINTVTKSGAIVNGAAVSHFNGWGMVIMTEQPSRVRNCSLSYNLNHYLFQVATGHSFLINSTAVNTTRPWYGLNMDTDGVGLQCSMGADATCSAIDSDIITTIGSSSAYLYRNVSIVDNAGQAVLAIPTKLWIEHSVFNITSQFVGDAGTLYSTPNPNTMLWSQFDNTMYGQSMDLDPQPAYTFGSSRAGFARKAGYWIGQSIVWHGVQFLNTYADVVGLTGGPQSMSYALDSFAQLSSILITGSSFTFSTPDGQSYPTTDLGSAGRPWGFNNTFLIYDAVDYNPIAMASDYPLFGPGFQGTGAATMWRWGTNAAPWVQNVQICYGQLDFQGSANNGAIDLTNIALNADYTAVPAFAQRVAALAGAIQDWKLAQANGSPAPQFGQTVCRNLKELVQQQLHNEAELHYRSTQPAMQAIIRSQMPFDLPSDVTPLAEASEWEAPMALYNPSPAWPTQEIYTSCSDPNSCQPYLVTAITPVATSGTWLDAVGQSTVAFVGFNGIGDYSDLSPRYIGTSYDNERGLVIDSSFAQGLYYSISYPTIHIQFTVMFWWYLPTFVSSSVVSLNRADPLFLGLEGNSNTYAGGAIYADSQGVYGSSGGATPSLQPGSNGGSSCCPFNNLTQTDGINCPVERSLMDTWVHYTAAVSIDYEYTRLYANGQPVFNCAGIFATIQPVWGGTNAMPFLSRFSGKVADMRVYAGKLSDAAILSIYESSAATYNGPSSFPVFGSNNQMIQVQYSAVLDTFVISSTETSHTVATLGQFNSAFLVSDPTGSISTPVLSPLAQFSFPTPPSLQTWTLTIHVLFTSTPQFTPWFYIPSTTPGQAQLMVLINSGNEICLYVGVQTSSSAQQGCVSGVVFALNAWSTYAFTFDVTTGQAMLWFNGQQVGPFAGITAGAYLATQQSLLFQVPTQYWLETESKITALNLGYISTVGLYNSLLYT